MSIKKMKLAAKTSVAIAIILTISLAILITVSVLSVSREMVKTIDGEFSGIAAQNGIIVQSIINDAANVAQNLQDYIENAYSTYSDVDMSVTTRQSAIYNAMFTDVGYEVENYILNTAWTTVKNNPDIIGIGAFFEPYAYEETIKDYTIYVSDSDANNKTAQSFGAYEEYSRNEYYEFAATTQKDYFTRPYIYEGITMVTASFPIVFGGETQGVIVVDINVDNFAKLKSSDEKYPTMAAFILTQDSTIVYFSLSKDIVGQTMERDMLSAE